MLQVHWESNRVAMLYILNAVAIEGSLLLL